MEIGNPREALKRLARERHVSLAKLSKLIGRNAAYIQQYVTRGTPEQLDERDRHLLASFLGVDEQLLGAPNRGSAEAALVSIPRLVVHASAGPGAIVDTEHSIGRIGFENTWLRQLTSARPDELSIIRVSGDSMVPTLMDGDDVLVDRSENGTRFRDGVYVIRRDDSLIIKRISIHPTSSTLTISSDNPTHPTWRDCPIESVVIVGRAIWNGRRLN